ncbi:DUF4124 domain-containing protein [Thiorhodococcus fuscus]|uniref:DUF4124 domain-containing protein n=1 Tax=Thiorhodococcus fuscus TaxID=527200 RepID=A0ABW4YE64_9GAMM
MHHAPRNALRLLGIALLLAGTAAQAELYKCRGSNGHTTYQQTACEASDQSAGLSVDTQISKDAPSAEDYSVGKQVESMRDARTRRAQAREQARRAEETERTRHADTHRFDAAKCAKHRSEVAKWHQKVLNGYRTRSEKDFNQNKLAYHQALVERYCE